MRQTITGLVEKPVDAQRIMEELTASCLADRSDISIVAQQNDLSRTVGQVTHAAGQVAGAAGAAVTSAASAMSGFASAVTRNIPGFGMLSAAGQLGAKLATTALRTAEDVTKAFVDLGVRQDVASRYAQALREGRILIVVDAKTDNIARCARQVMATHGAVAPDEVT